MNRGKENTKGIVCYRHIISYGKSRKQIRGWWKG